MKRYNPKEIEPKWQKIWDETQVYKADLQSDKPKYLAMSMFNYPSGAGIHIGHAMNYTISDVMARFKRQQGYESYHPVGWDAFGLPAENYAIKSGVSPQASMATIIPMYHQQYRAMGWSNDWSREIATCDPAYYKWTQWIFWKMHDRGMAYQDERQQWWCTKCQTVLSNEQVIDGKCWRHDSTDDPEVGKRAVKQWFFRITDYADEMLEATYDLDWSDVVKTAQINWIGRSQGAEITFALAEDTALRAASRESREETKPNFVILHGFTGRADKEFIPTLKQQLETDGYRVQAPQMPNTDHTVEKDQVNYVLKNCTFDENTVVIGHSLGGAVAMKVLQELDYPVRALVLVAPVIEPAFRPDNYKNQNSNKVRTFVDTFDLTYDYDQIIKKAKSRIILSDTGEAENRKPYLEYLAPKIKAELHETTAKRVHFTADDEPFIYDTLHSSFILHYSDDEVITVFTTRPDTLYGATFLVLAPEHPLVRQIVTDDTRSEIEAYITEAAKKDEVERQENKDKTGVFTGAYAINPANGQKIPVWTADYVLVGYGTGAIMAVPAHDQRDNEFAEKFDLPIIRVVQNDAADSECSHEEGVMMNSGVYNGMASADAREKIVADLAAKGVATAKTNYKIRDWSVGRQRYWGAPIPIIHCKKCGPVLVPEADLPVVLPELEDFAPSGDGRSALARAAEWLKVDCPKCGGPGERETDTLDTYICSSWYELRYLDPANDKAPFGKAVADKWAPIDFYNGGDHATAHLIYVRFITRFFHKLGMLNTPEPFKKFLFNGKVTAADGTMFSKSKGNGVDPLEIIAQGYGADALRTYLMFAAPLDLWARWDPQGVPGTYRFLNRVWNLTQEYVSSREPRTASHEAGQKAHGSLKFTPELTRLILDGKKTSTIRLEVKDLAVGDTADFLTREGATVTSFGQAEITQVRQLKLRDIPNNLAGHEPMQDDQTKLDMYRKYYSDAITLDTEFTIYDFEFLSSHEPPTASHKLPAAAPNSAVLRTIHKTIHKVTADLEEQKYNTAIAAMMECTNELYKLKTKGFADTASWQFALESLVALTAPFAPHTADELWHDLGHDSSVQRDSWPLFDEQYLSVDTTTLAVQVNGKVRDEISVEANADEATAVKMAKRSKKAAAYLDGKQVIKTIYVRGRLISFVVR